MRERSTLGCILVLWLLTLTPGSHARAADAEEGDGRKGPVDAVLQAVEQEQTTGARAERSIDNRNLLLWSYFSYVQGSGYSNWRWAYCRAIDGNEKSFYAIGGRETKGWLDISMGLLKTVDRVMIYEAGGGGGITSFDLLLYDGRKWQSVARGEKLGNREFTFTPMKASAVRIEWSSNGGGGIAEIQAFDSSGKEDLKPGEPSKLLQEVFKQDRVAILLGSPLAMTGKGKAFFCGTDPEVRPLPDSGRYLPAILRFLTEQFGGTCPADEPAATKKMDGQKEEKEREAASVFRGKVKGKDIELSLPDPRGPLSQQQVLDVFQQFSARSGIPCQSAPGSPLLVFFGAPLPTASQEKVCKEVQGLLAADPGALARGGPMTEPREPDAVVCPTRDVMGKTMKWVAPRADLNPGTNEAAWMGYFRPNAIRTWYGCGLPTKYMSVPKTPIGSIEEFDRLRAAVRADPESKEFFRWEDLCKAEIHKQMTYEFGICKKLGIEVVNETGSKDWPNDWMNNYRNWLQIYGTTYHLAKHFDVAVHQFGNEPDGYVGKKPAEEIALKFQLTSDAIHSAIEDVNRNHKKNLVAGFAAPVLAGNACADTARIMMRNLRTDYHGRKMDRDLVQFYDRHRYCDRPYQYVDEIEGVNKMMLEESATGKVLPQIFTELNFSTGNSWLRNKSFTSDSPWLIHVMGAVWGQMMATQKVHGIFLFKLNGEDIKWTNTVCYKFIRETDEGPARTRAKGDIKADIGYTTKNAELLRLFAEGFPDQRDLLKTRVDCADRNFAAFTCIEPVEKTYYLWMVQPNDYLDYGVQLDLSSLDVLPGAPVLVREVSGGSFGEAVFSGPLPENRILKLTQPRASVWLVSVPAGRKLASKTCLPVADATIRQGKDSGKNFGKEKTLAVQRHSNPGNNQITFLKFNLGEIKQDKVYRAMLRVHGQRKSDYAYDDTFTFRVYGTTEDGWSEAGLKAENAPAVCRNVSAMRGESITLESPPVGHMSFSNKAGFSEIDVTRFVREHADKELTFVLIREVNWPGENTDFARVELDSRESAEDLAPRLEVEQ